VKSESELRSYPYLGIVEVRKDECPFCSGLPRRVFVVWFWCFLAAAAVGLSGIGVMCGVSLWKMAAAEVTR
jgi:hypothetical protein